jgi:CspA family cold shock protein
MPTGKVSFYDESRGFGFITPDDGGADIFGHAKYILNAPALKRDQRVSFEIVMDDLRGKPRADRIRLLDGAVRTGRLDPIAYDNDFLLNGD